MLEIVLFFANLQSAYFLYKEYGYDTKPSSTEGFFVTYLCLGFGYKNPNSCYFGIIGYVWASSLY